MKDNHKTTLLIMSSVLNVVFIGSMVYYLFLSCSASSRMSEPRSFLYQELDLTKEQLSMVEPMRDRFHARLGEMGSDIKSKQLKLVDLLDDSDLNFAAINAQQEEIHALQQKVQDLIIRHLLDETKVFSPEQRRCFFKLMRERIEQNWQICPPWMKASDSYETFKKQLVR